MARTYLKQFREDNEIKSGEMAKRLGLSESYYSLIENGQRQKPMDITLVSRISAVTGMSIGEIVEMEEAE